MPTLARADSSGTRPTHAAHQRSYAPPPRTHAAAQALATHPRSTRAPRTQERPEHTRPGMHPLSPRKQAFLHMRAHDSGNKIAASAHGMGSGGSAVDAMVIGCLSGTLLRVTGPLPSLVLSVFSIQ